jgi:hypothetical protein
LQGYCLDGQLLGTEPPLVNLNVGSPQQRCSTQMLGTYREANSRVVVVVVVVADGVTGNIAGKLDFGQAAAAETAAGDALLVIVGTYDALEGEKAVAQLVQVFHETDTV